MGVPRFSSLRRGLGRELPNNRASAVLPALGIRLPWRKVALYAPVAGYASW